MQEGVCAEAVSLAGHLGLGRLIVLYDDNKITIDGSTDLSFTEDVEARFRSYGWHTQYVANGNTDIAGIEAAIRAAQAETSRPSLIRVATTIAFGSKRAGHHDTHGAPLGKEDIKYIKTSMGFDPEASFAVAEDVLSYYRNAGARGDAAAAAWKAGPMAAYANAYPAEAAELSRRMAGILPANWTDKLPRFTAADKADATRNWSGAVLGAIGAILPELIGGSADLTPSNKTWYKGLVDFQKNTPAGRYIRFGVREHAMAAVCNGLAAYGGFLPYCGTFLNFIGYALGSVRLSALSHFRVLYVATHDSIGLGEDGPTHQPVEMLESLRSMPNMYVYRPCGGNETSAAYAAAVSNPDHPAVLALSRGNMPNLPGASFEKAMLGGYTIFDTSSATGTADDAAPGTPSLIIAATGTEVPIAVDAAKIIASTSNKRVAVASFPCLELFEKQSEEYKRSVLKVGVPVLSVEASAIKGWERYAHAWVGLSTFGLSGPANDVYKALHMTKDTISARGTKMIDYYSQNAVPLLPLFAPQF
jgi:transketolase